jgi:hypothetical protein
MRFDITGSSLALTGFQVKGQTATALAPDWHANLEMEKSQVAWRKPMHLDMKAALTIKDTRPFVALLEDVRGEQRWLDDFLLVEDLAGSLQLVIDGNNALLKDARVSGKNVGVQAKGHAAADRREAMLLVRWHGFAGALAMEDDWQQFELGDAHARFDAYRRPMPDAHAQPTTGNRGEDGKLWLRSQALTKLRNNMDAAEYKHVVLGLIFLKYISDTFEEQRAKLRAGQGDYAGANPEDPDEYRPRTSSGCPPRPAGPTSRPMPSKPPSASASTTRWSPSSATTRAQGRPAQGLRPPHARQGASAN